MSLNVFTINTSKINQLWKKSNKFNPRSYLIRKAAKNYFNYKQIYKDEELSKFENPKNKEWKQSKNPMNMHFYIQHPKKEKYLIESTDFLNFIHKEQMMEIYDYVVSSLKIKSIKINILQGQEISTKGEIPLEEGQFNYDARFSYNSNAVIDYSADNILEGINRNNYYWLDEFPEVKDLVKRYKNGKARICFQYDYSFGITIGVDKIINLGIDNSSKKTKFEMIIES